MRPASRRCRWRTRSCRVAPCPRVPRCAAGRGARTARRRRAAARQGRMRSSNPGSICRRMNSNSGTFASSVTMIAPGATRLGRRIRQPGMQRHQAGQSAVAEQQKDAGRTRRQVEQQCAEQRQQQSDASNAARAAMPPRQRSARVRPRSPRLPRQPRRRARARPRSGAGQRRGLDGADQRLIADVIQARATPARATVRQSLPRCRDSRTSLSSSPRRR